MADDSISDDFPKTRAEAKAKGAKRYFTGAPCKHSHLAPRLTSTGRCVTCTSMWFVHRPDKNAERFVVADDGIGRKVISRAHAKAAGLHRYFTGLRCKHGHISERFAAGACCKCAEIWNADNIEGVRLYQRNYARKNWRKHYHRKARVKSKSKSKGKSAFRKLEREERYTLLAGRPRPQTCEVCDKRTLIHFDHCHLSGHFRGWICDRCNLVLGQTKDSPSLLRKLADYLDLHNARTAQFDWVVQVEVGKAMRKKRA